MIRRPDGEPMGGIKMANGTNPMREPPFAGTRGKAAAMVRDLFTRGAEYAARHIAGELRGSRRPGRAPADGDAVAAHSPPGRRAGATWAWRLVEVLDGRRIVHHHTHRADDIMTVLRLREEFGFRVVLHHVSEAWKVADESRGGRSVLDHPCRLAGRKVGGFGTEFRDRGGAGRAGVQVAFHTDDWITDSRLFLRMAALGVRAGMSRAGALAALTIRGAEMMDLQDRIGTLEAGKDADFVILSGDPFSVYTRIEQTWVEGVRVFDLSDEKDRLHAEGGFGAGRDQTPYFCCFDADSFVFGRSGTVWQAGGK